jgi:hypothetical protein
MSNKPDNVVTLDSTRAMLKSITQRHKAGRRDYNAEPEGVVNTPTELSKNYHSSTVILCKDIADLLVRHYPDWAWAVQPDEFGKVINIFNLNLHSEYGYTIRMVDIMYDPSRREAIKAGAEILKRFNMPKRMDRTRLAEAPRDARGMCIPDISDFKSKKERMNAEIAMGLATGKMEIVETPDGKRYLKVDNT